MASYGIQRFEMIRREWLRPHPAAELPVDEDAEEALGESVRENGVLIPLLVVEADAEAGRYLIVDGCTRYRNTPDEAVLPCLVIETDDPGRVVGECLSQGRPRSAGHRIMVYLEAHWSDVVAAAAVEGGKGSNLRPGGRSSTLSRESVERNQGISDFSAASISKRLRVCQEDVLAGIELLRERESEKSAALTDLSGKGLLGPVEEQWRRVIGGSVGIRRWKAAVSGRVTEQHGAAEPNLAKRVATALGALDRALDGWEHLDEGERVLMREKAGKVWARMAGTGDDPAERALVAIAELRTIWGTLGRMAPETRAHVEGLAATLHSFLPPAAEGKAYAERHAAKHARRGGRQ